MRSVNLRYRDVQNKPPPEIDRRLGSRRRTDPRPWGSHPFLPIHIDYIERTRCSCVGIDHPWTNRANQASNIRPDPVRFVEPRVAKTAERLDMSVDARVEGGCITRGGDRGVAGAGPGERARGVRQDAAP